MKLKIVFSIVVVCATTCLIGESMENFALSLQKINTQELNRQISMLETYLQAGNLQLLKNLPELFYALSDEAKDVVAKKYAINAEQFSSFFAKNQLRQIPTSKELARLYSFLDYVIEKNIDNKHYKKLSIEHKINFVQNPLIVAEIITKHSKDIKKFDKYKLIFWGKQLSEENQKLAKILGSNEDEAIKQKKITALAEGVFTEVIVVSEENMSGLIEDDDKKQFEALLKKGNLRLLQEPKKYQDFSSVVYKFFASKYNINLKNLSSFLEKSLNLSSDIQEDFKNIDIKKDQFGTVSEIFGFLDYVINLNLENKNYKNLSIRARYILVEKNLIALEILKNKEIKKVVEKFTLDELKELVKNIESLRDYELMKDEQKGSEKIKILINGLIKSQQALK